MERWHLNMVMKEVRQWVTWTFGRTTSQRNANRWGKSRNSDKFYFLGPYNHCRWWLQPWNSKTLAPWKKSYDELKQCIKKQRHHFANKHPYSQSYGFSSSHVRMWALDHKEGWAMKNWCFQTVVLEKTSESLGQQGDQTSQSWWKSTLIIHWMLIGRTDGEAEAPTLCPPNVKSQLIGKDPDAGKDWEQEKGWQRMRWFDGLTNSVNLHFGQTQGGSEGQGSLACCSPWNCKGLDTT